MLSKNGALAMVVALLVAAAMAVRTEATELQTLLQSLPMCTAPPSPETDTWPVAAIDLLGPTAGAMTFAGSALVVNDTGTAPLTAAIPAESATTQSGGTVSGTGPFTYTPAPAFTGTDVFTYELADGLGHKTIGIVRVTVVADGIPPTVSMVSPTGGTVFGSTLLTAAAGDNVAVAGVLFLLDGVTPIGAEITTGSIQTTWNTTLATDGAHMLSARARDTAGNTATSAPVPVTVANSVIVPNVGGMLQADAQAAITAAPLVPSVTTAPSSTVPSGRVISQNPAGDTSAPRNSTVAIVVSTGAATAGLAVDKTVFSDGLGRRTTPVFSTTTAGDVLVAFAASDGPASADSQRVTISGAGLTWTRVQRVAARFGDSEIWTAKATGTLTNVTVTSTQLVGGNYQSLTVIAFKGASGVGASNINSGLTGGPSASLTLAASGSLVYAVGNDWDRAAARTIPAGQTKVHEYFAPNGDTLWVQALSGAAGASGGVVTLNATSPTNDQWNMAIVEIKQ